jgi:hypothetical protein
MAGLPSKSNRLASNGLFLPLSACPLTKVAKLWFENEPATPAMAFELGTSTLLITERSSSNSPLFIKLEAYGSVLPGGVEPSLIKLAR